MNSSTDTITGGAGWRERWDKQRELTQPELERIRLHPYLTERMLASSPGLAPLAALAAQHHERLDGSGYPRGLPGTAPAPGLTGREVEVLRLLAWVCRTRRSPSGW